MVPLPHFAGQERIETTTDLLSLCPSRRRAARERACTAFRLWPVAPPPLRTCGPSSRAAARGRLLRAGSAGFCSRANRRGRALRLRHEGVAQRVSTALINFSDRPRRIQIGDKFFRVAFFEHTDVKAHFRKDENINCSAYVRHLEDVSYSEFSRSFLNIPEVDEDFCTKRSWRRTSRSVEQQKDFDSDIHGGRNGSTQHFPLEGKDRLLADKSESSWWYEAAEQITLWDSWLRRCFAESIWAGSLASSHRYLSPAAPSVASTG